MGVDPDTVSGRVAELTATAGGFTPEQIGPVAGPLFDQLCTAVERCGASACGGIAHYEPSGDGVVVPAAMPVDLDPDGDYDFAVVDLPAIEAATIVHRGSMDDVMGTLQTLVRWIEENGYRSFGYNRELYLEMIDGGFVVELQEPVVQADLAAAITSSTRTR